VAELSARAIVLDRGSSGRVLDGIDLSIESGELVAVMGGTGAGKSSLALVLAGLLEPTGGSVDGDAMGQVRLVLQRPESTFLADSVLGEVMLAPIARGEPAGAAERHAHEQLARLGLDAQLARRDPLTLSGGEQRRVAIAATLAADARVLVLDEPGAGLDRAARGALHDTIADLHASGRTIIMITHDPDEAARLATRLVVVEHGRIAWDGPVAAVLGRVERAAAVGVGVAPEVHVLTAAALARGVAPPATDGSGADAMRVLADLLRAGSAAASTAASPCDSTVPPRARRTPLAPLVDARARIVATTIVMIAALAAGSLLAAGIVLVATSIVLLAARIERARVRLAVRPLIALTVLLVALQLLVGGAPDVELRRGVAATSSIAPALMRAMQASAVVLVTLVLSARTSALDLSTALRRLLAPLRFIGVPVAALAFVIATGLGLVPAMSDELERLRLAQRARGLRPAGRGTITRLRADLRLIGPLFVAAFRRAHLLADALAVRGLDPRRALRPWRSMHVPSSDTALLIAGIALLAVSRFA
jgi:energy-coupling factor transport system ATP-binding protein